MTASTQLNQRPVYALVCDVDGVLAPLFSSKEGGPTIKAQELFQKKPDLDLFGVRSDGFTEFEWRVAVSHLFIPEAMVQLQLRTWQAPLWVQP